MQTEGNLLGYLECDTPEFMSEETPESPWHEDWSWISEDLFRYRKARGGNSEGFFILKNAKVETQMREYRAAKNGSWTIPFMKHVFILTKHEAARILAIRERFVNAMTDEEHWERQTTNAPFDEEFELLREFDP